jgi:glycosyltransferase involved in cell wall biosynthesis
MTTKESSSLVTVIMIFLNAGKFIDEAIASVTGQTHTEWELLVVDDGSTDASSAIARRWADSQPGKIRYLEHPGHENRGMSASRNRGLQEARGEFVAFLDADDVWLPRKLEEQLAVMRLQPRAAMVYGRTEIWFSWTGEETDRGRDHTLDLGVPRDTLVEPPALLLLLLENRVQNPTTCSVLLRREVFDQVGGFQDAFRGMFEDQAFFNKVCLKFPVYVSGHVWARYRQHPESCCAGAEAAGTSEAARLPLLRWIRRYFADQHVRDPRLLRALDNELYSASPPAWIGLRTQARRLLGFVRRRMRRMRPNPGNIDL